MCLGFVFCVVLDNYFPGGLVGFTCYGVLGMTTTLLDYDCRAYDYYGNVIDDNYFSGV